MTSEDLEQIAAHLKEAGAEPWWMEVGGFSVNVYTQGGQHVAQLHWGSPSPLFELAVRRATFMVAAHNTHISSLMAQVSALQATVEDLRTAENELNELHSYLNQLGLPEAGYPWTEAGHASNRVCALHDQLARVRDHYIQSLREEKGRLDQLIVDVETLKGMKG